MELKAYVRILLRRWWLLLAAFLVVFLAVWHWTLQQPPVYEAKTTFIMRPRAELVMEDEYVRTLDLVSRRAEINATFAEVASSKSIRDQAIERLDLPAREQKGLAVSTRIIGGTNILEITVQGRDPLVVRDFANAIGAETINYVSSLYDVFELGLLDDAALPGAPVKPTVALNLSLGAILGLALGVALVFLLSYLETPHAAQDSFNIVDRDTGAYNKSYLLHRLGQEMSRARRNHYPLSLALIKVETGNGREENLPAQRTEALRLIRLLVENSLRDEDLITRLDEQTLAILLPDMTEARARTVIDELEPLLASVPHTVTPRNGRSPLGITAGVIAYHDHGLGQEQFLAQATVRVAAGPAGASTTNGAANHHFRFHNWYGRQRAR